MKLKHLLHLSLLQRRDHAFGDARIAEPARAHAGQVQHTIVSTEALTGGVFASRSFEVCRERPVQPPSNENFSSGRLPVWKISLVISHCGLTVAQTSVCVQF